MSKESNLALLKKYWGYNSFRGIQEDIIESIEAGNDTLGLMPTGGGKSITFQIPALAADGLCIVITPLIALMKDQVLHLRQHGIMATAVYSGMKRTEIITALENCIFGDYKFLYISPERIATDIFKIKLRSMKISLITVDESHCISQWGYDFRPAYLSIADIRKMLPGIPVLALTATATPEVVDDIQEKLEFRKKNVFSMSFERKNLAYIVRYSDDKENELIHILSHVEGSAIVYVRSRLRTKEIASRLHNEGFTAEFYHAGLDNAVKDLRQKRWQNDESRVMVATNAFGMGIDKPDVRLVVHMDLPDSVEAYFQEAGRGGRDGEKAYAVLLYSNSDKEKLNRRIPETFPEKEYILRVYENLQYYYCMAMGDGLGCVKEFNINDFCTRFKFFPVQVESALHILTLAGYLEYTEEHDNSSRVSFTINRDELYRLRDFGEDVEVLIRTLLRSYTGLFSDYVYISETTLGVNTGLTPQRVYDILIMLSKQRIIDYIPHKKIPYIIYTRERTDISEIHIPKAVYEERKKRYAKRMKSIIQYASDDYACRSRMLLHYFGENNPHNCGQCDNCLKFRKEGLTMQVPVEETSNNILRYLTDHPAITPIELAQKMDVDYDRMADILREMLEDGSIVLNDGLMSKAEVRH